MKASQAGRKIGGHPLWHLVVMVLYLEVMNFIWFLAGLVFLVVGWLIFNSSKEAFFKLAIGLPLVLVGASVALFKVYEFLQTILRSERLKATCIFCAKNQGIDEE